MSGRTCSECAKPITVESRSGKCRACVLAVARASRRRAPAPLRFCVCSSVVSRQSKSGLCKPCSMAWINSNPEILKKRGDTFRRLHQIDPTYRERMREGQRRANQCPDLRKRKSEASRKAKNWLKAIGPSHTPEANRKRTESRLNTIYAWCPQELRGEYRRLVECYGYKAADARAIILAQHDANMARFRRSIGAA